MTTFTIPVEFVTSARSGIYLDMHCALDEATTLVQACGCEERPAIDLYVRSWRASTPTWRC